MVWSGWGAVTVLFFAFGELAGDGIGEGLGGARSAVNLGTAAGVAGAGVGLWFFGRWLNRPGERYDPRTARWTQNATGTASSSCPCTTGAW